MTVIASWLKQTVFAREDRKPLFERLMRDTSRQAFGMAYRLTGSRQEAEDLVQETYLRAYRFFHRYDESLPFTSWLYRIMTNIHIDSSRRRSRLKTVSLEREREDGSRTWEFADEAAGADSALMNETLEEPIQMGLKAMNSEFRTAVVLSDVEGLSYEEIADIMGTSVGTVRSRIHRGRKQLRESLKGTAFDLTEAEAL